MTSNRIHQTLLNSFDSSKNLDVALYSCRSQTERCAVCNAALNLKTTSQPLFWYHCVNARKLGKKRRNEKPKQKQDILSKIKLLYVYGWLFSVFNSLHIQQMQGKPPMWQQRTAAPNRYVRLTYLYPCMGVCVCVCLHRARISAYGISSHIKMHILYHRCFFSLPISFVLEANKIQRVCHES